MGTSLACAVAEAGAWRKTQCPSHGASCASGNAPSVWRLAPHRERHAGVAWASSGSWRESPGPLQAGCVASVDIVGGEDDSSSAAVRDQAGRNIEAQA
ncbi:hypothetical protein XFF4834R_chr17550 [Xanthomonas citri pv. fuscans]|nr:hypothetical protein XFF4834R_chr17550 [Xanthomonas citri pv. fuscans]